MIKACQILPHDAHWAEPIRPQHWATFVNQLVVPWRNYFISYNRYSLCRL